MALLTEADTCRRYVLPKLYAAGKTVIAFQICYKLWNSRWNRTGEHRRPRILYLADRNIRRDFAG
jgi:type I restriction enzyme R subunit